MDLTNPLAPPPAPPFISTSATSNTAEPPSPHRLSTPFSTRLPLSLLLTSLAGFSLGLSQGSLTSGLRFRAENAHRFPTDPRGWYFYHKSKNYHMALGGLKEGMRMGARMAWWGCGFVVFEEGVDWVRFGLRGARRKGREEEVMACGDFLSSVIAGLGVAGWFSVWNRFPLPTAARTAKSGLLFGLVYGLAQDAVSLMKGRRLGNVDFLLGRKRKDRRERERESQDGRVVVS